jgi:TonB-dependent receptor
MRGKIVDAFGKDPLPFANVVLVGTSRGTASDMEGNFSLKNIDPGEYTVEVSYLGYNSITEKVTIKANATLEVNFELIALTIEGNEVVVTAQAEGQMDAINEQLNSNTIKNVVSSARIQEIPDANAAESVGRLPGISIKRSGGEGNKVVIRGLSPKYNTINLNGVKMPSTGSGDRSTDISMISPYMLEGIEVVKSITPDQDADVLGGAVNFKIRKAPKLLKIDGIVQGGYNGLENTTGDYKIVLSGSNRFFDDKLGVFAQGDIEKRNRSADELNVGHDIVNPSLDKVNTVNAISSKFKKISRNRDRYGAAFVLDYKLDEGSIIFSNFAFAIGPFVA